MSNLTEYQKEKFDQIQTLVEDRWYKLDIERPDYDEFLACLKLYADVWGTLEFNGTFTRFRRYRAFCKLPESPSDMFERNRDSVNKYHDKVNGVPSHRKYK